MPKSLPWVAVPTLALLVSSEAVAGRDLVLIESRGTRAGEALYRAITDNLDLDEASRRIAGRAASVPAIAGFADRIGVDFAVTAAPRGKRLEVMVVARDGRVVFSTRASLARLQNAPVADRVARDLLAAVREHRFPPPPEPEPAPEPEPLTETSPDDEPVVTRALLADADAIERAPTRLRLQLGGGAWGYRERAQSRSRDLAVSVPLGPELSAGVELEREPASFRLSLARQQTKALSGNDMVALTSWEASATAGVSLLVPWVRALASLSYTRASPSGARDFVPESSRIAGLVGGALTTAESLPFGIEAAVEALWMPWASASAMPLAAGAPTSLSGGRAQARLRWSGTQLYIELAGIAELTRSSYEGTGSTGGEIVASIDEVHAERRRFGGGVSLGWLTSF